MSERRASAVAKHNDQNQTCPLRGLNVCDGHVLVMVRAGLKWCCCDLEEAARDAGWDGAADSHRADRDDLAESIRRHPANYPDLD